MLSEKPVYKIPDFVVQIPEGRNPIVLQLTDPQIIDATQQRYEERLGGLYAQYLPENMDARCFDYMRQTIETVNPDLIILTGDLVYGEFDDKGTSFTKFVEFMDSFGVPWAPVMGNHEAESTRGVDWQCDALANSTYCLFDRKELTGNGNYSVGIAQGGKLIRVFYMVDSNGTGASPQSLANGHTKTSAGFGQDQIDWYTDEITAIHTLSPDTKISFAFHIQIAAFADAYAKYGFTNSGTANNPINIDLLKNKEDGDFGYLGWDLKGAWDTDKTVFTGLKALGVDSIFIGHEHCNSASVVWEGIRFQFGQKSSTYDRYNYVDMASGAVVGSYDDGGIPLVGCTVIPLCAGTGEIVDPYIFLCKNAGGNIDRDR